MLSIQATLPWVLDHTDVDHEFHSTCAARILNASSNTMANHKPLLLKTIKVHGVMCKLGQIG